MDGGEFLKRLHVAETCHCSFSSPERLVGILGSIVEPATALLIGSIADYLHRRSVGAKPVGYYDLWPAVTLHRTLQKRKRSLAISPFRRENFKHLAFVINRTPQVMRLTVDPHENLVQVPATVRIAFMLNAAFPDLRREHWTEPVPPEPNCLMADIDSSLR